MTDLGHYSLLASLVTCLWGLAAGILGGRFENQALKRSAERSINANLVLLLAASASLAALLLADNFSVRYVASYSSRNMPVLYKVSAFWGGQEGSLLFWALTLAAFSVVAIRFSRKLDSATRAYFIGFLAGIMAFFSLLVLCTGDPFALMDRPVPDGQGLNPLLQNWYMVIHPPVLFLGFAAVAVPFALALAAMAGGFRDQAWLRTAGTWSMISWIFLTAGITLGGRWAYEELGWGGYWAWDPVENASLLPWLVMTGLLHSLIQYRWKGTLKIWSFILLLAAFELTIFGTFITRSGVLSSVHAFGNSGIGPFLVWFMVLSSLFFLGWMILRRRHFGLGSSPVSPLARDFYFVLANWVLVLLTVAIFAGTMMPAVSELATGRKVSIDGAFYNQVSWPFGLLLMLLTGICTLLGWKNAGLRVLGRRLVIPAAASVLALVLLLISGIREGIALAYFSTAVFVFVTISWNIGGAFFARLKEDGAGILKSGFRFASTSARLIAGGLVHAGLVLVLIGIISSSFYSREETFVVKEGGVFQMEDYTLTLKRVREERDQVKDMVITEVEVIRNGKITGILSPQKHFHRNHEQPMTEIALDQSLSRDLYLILYGWDGDGNFSFRVIINPLIGLIWWGVVLMCLAGAWRMTSVLLERDRGRFSMQAGPFGRS